MKLHHSEYSRSFNLDLKPLIALGILIILICIVGAGFWSYKAPLHSASLASGKLVTELENQQVQHPTGGVVEELLIQEGQKVQKGDLLLLLSDPRLTSELEQLHQHLFNAQSQLDRVEAELSGEPIEWTSLHAIATPIQLQIRNDQVALLNQKRLIQKEKITSNLQQISQATNTQNSDKAWLLSDERSLKLFNEELDANSSLLEKGYVSKVAFLELQREYSSLVARIAEHKANIQKSQSKIAELISIQESLRIDFKRSAQEEKQDLLAEIQTIQKQISASKTLNDRIEIRAPASGEIINLSIHTKGGVIPPTSPVLEIVPERSRIVANVHINPKDIEAVYEGLSANIRLTSYSFRELPAVSGELIHLSADSITEPHLGTLFYQGKIAFDPKELSELGLVLKPGMPVEAQIVLKERTVLDYLLSPLIQSLEKGMKET